MASTANLRRTTHRPAAARPSLESALAAGVGVSCAAVGLTLSYHLATPPGATIALVCVAVLTVSFAATLPRRATRPVAHAAELTR